MDTVADGEAITGAGGAAAVASAAAQAEPAAAALDEVGDLAMPDARNLNRLLAWLVTAPEARLSREEVEGVRAAEAAALDCRLGVRPHLLVGAAEVASFAGAGGDPAVDGQGRSQHGAELWALQALVDVAGLEPRSCAAATAAAALDEALHAEAEAASLRSATRAGGAAVEIEAGGDLSSDSELWVAVDASVVAAPEMSVQRPAAAPADRGAGGVSPADLEALDHDMDSPAGGGGVSAALVADAAPLTMATEGTAAAAAAAAASAAAATTAPAATAAGLAPVRHGNASSPWAAELAHLAARGAGWARSRRARRLLFAWLLHHGAPPSEFEAAAFLASSASSSSAAAATAATAALATAGAAAGEGDAASEPFASGEAVTAGVLASAFAGGVADGTEAAAAPYGWADVAGALAAGLGGELGASVGLSSASVAAVYLRCVLPLLVALARLPPSADGLVGSSGGASGGAGDCDVPDPLRPLAAHSSAARRLALLCLRRQQLLLACRFVLARPERRLGLAAFLRSPAARARVEAAGGVGAAAGQAVAWWCPWLHDAALVAATHRHGLLRCLREASGEAEGGGGGGGGKKPQQQEQQHQQQRNNKSEAARGGAGGEPALPTYRPEVAALVRRTFIDGAPGRRAPAAGVSPHPPPSQLQQTSGSVHQLGFGADPAVAVAAASGVFASVAEAEAWAVLAAEAFPSRHALEQRLEMACAAATRHCLPTGHPLHVRPSPLAPPLRQPRRPLDATAAAATAAAASSSEVLAPPQAPRPPLALPVLLAESRDRRAAYLARRTAGLAV